MSAGPVRLYLAQAGKCFHCGNPMLRAPAAWRKNGVLNAGYTLEHVVPLSKGGVRGYSNVVLAHAKCNNKRGNREFDADERLRAHVIRERANALTVKEARRRFMHEFEAEPHTWE